MAAQHEGVSPASADGAPALGPWDVGHSSATGGRNLYVRSADGDVYVGVIFEPADARRIVQLMNAEWRADFAVEADPRDVEIERLTRALRATEGRADAELAQLRTALTRYQKRLGDDLLCGGKLVERVRAALRVDNGGTCTRASMDGVVGDVGRLCDEVERLRGKLDNSCVVVGDLCKERDEAAAELDRIATFVGGSAAMPGSVRSAVEAEIGRRDAKHQRAWEQAITPLVGERDRLRRELARERAIYADSPDDRLYHAADNTWWRRNDNGRLVEAERPQLADITAERDQLRQQLAAARPQFKMGDRVRFGKYLGTVVDPWPSVRMRLDGTEILDYPTKFVHRLCNDENGDSRCVLKPGHDGDWHDSGGASWPTAKMPASATDEEVSF